MTSPAPSRTIKAKKVVAYNLIPFFDGREKNVLLVEGSPELVLKAIWKTCSHKDKDMATWAATVEEHCPIPPSHPFRKRVDRLLAGDPLRTLGCWAYGAENGWITIDEVVWEDGSRSSPQEEHRQWLRREAAKVLK